MKFRTIVSLSFVMIAGAALAADIDPDLLAGMQARAIGPAGMSGRIAAIDAVASDPAIVFVGAATGGVWKSVDGGLTFAPMFDKQPVAAIGALAVFQANPAIVWAGTGESNVRNSASVGDGVYRSLDGGRTWKHVGLDGTERISRIVLHPTDPDVAWVAALGREWGENPERGVFKTSDGGATWQKVLYVDERTGAADLAIDPASPNTLFAAMWQYRRWPFFFRSGGPGSGLFVSHDGGATWKKRQQEDGLPKGPLGRIGLAICQSRPNVVYALVEAEKSALIRSDDGGHSFVTVNDKPNVSPRPFYFADIRVDPECPTRVYALDYDVRVSDDGGKTFTSLPGAKDLHGDFHAMWIDPHHGEHFYLGDDGGFSESLDCGRTMRFITNLPLGQFYHIAVDDQLPYSVMGGMQDNGSWHGPSSVWAHGGIHNYEWANVGGGDGFDVRSDPTDPQIGYAMMQGGALVRWDLRAGVERPIRVPQGDGPKLRFNWNAGLALDPFAPGTIYYGSQFLHRSTDRGDTWTTISPDLTTNNPLWQHQDQSGGLTPDVSDAENYCTIIAIAPSPRERGVIWVGTDDGRIQLTRDGGASWTSVEGNVKGVPTNTWVPHITASRYDAGEAFIVFDDHRRSNWTPYVYHTTDFGKTWTSLVTPELRGWALVVAQDPVKRDLLFLGTEFGLWVSLDGGAHWLPFRHGVPTVSVMDLAIQEREADLVIGTHGRSALIVDDIRPLRELSAGVLAEPIHVFDGATGQEYARRPEAGAYNFGAGEFHGESRPYGAILTYSLNLPELPLPDADKEKERREKERAAKLAAGYGWGPEAPKRVTPEAAQPAGDEAPKATIRVLDASGTIVRTFTAPATLGVNRAVWDLRRDAFKQPPHPQELGKYEREPAGPEMPPGSYTAVVSYGGHEARAAVTVLADPRSANTAADWQRRWTAIVAAGALNDGAVDAIRRIRDTRADVEAILTRMREQAAEKAAPGEVAEQQKKVAEQPLAKSGRALVEHLTALEKRLWTPPETVGMPAENDVMSAIGQAAWGLQGSWAPPTPSDQARLERARGKLAEVLKDTDALFSGELATFRHDVDAAGIRLLPEVAPLAPAR